MAAAQVLELDGDNWQREVVFGDQPVLVDFWSPDCAPCVKLSPLIDKVARQFAGRVKVGKVNVQDNFDLAEQYGISSVPRLLFFNRNNKPSQELRGLVSEGELVKALNKLLGA